jgi:hypothetical protein
MRTLVLAVLLAGCAQTIVEYPSVCTAEDDNCKRSLNARTLSDIGYGEAALELMCKDADVRSVLDKCNSTGHSRGLQQQQ